MKTRSAPLLLVVCLCAAFSAMGYNVPTHRTLTGRAVNASVLPERLNDLGLDSLTQEIDDFTVDWTIGPVEMCWPRLLPATRTVLEMIRLGAHCEDMTFGDGEWFRYVYHFFDPAHEGKGLGNYDSSLLWSLNTNLHAYQTFAYDNARSYLEHSGHGDGGNGQAKGSGKFPAHPRAPLASNTGPGPTAAYT